MKKEQGTFLLAVVLVLPCVAGVAIFLLPFLEAGQISRWQLCGGLLAVTILAALILLSIALSIDNLTTLRQERIDQYLKAEGVIHAHIRDHVIRDKDLTWAAGNPEIVTLGVRKDGTIMSGEDLSAAFRAANIQAPNKNAPCSG